MPEETDGTNGTTIATQTSFPPDPDQASPSSYVTGLSLSTQALDQVLSLGHRLRVVFLTHQFQTVISSGLISNPRLIEYQSSFGNGRQLICTKSARPQKLSLCSTEGKAQLAPQSSDRKSVV